jgi:hypothetical protein
VGIVVGLGKLGGLRWEIDTHPTKQPGSRFPRAKGPSKVKWTSVRENYGMWVDH